MRRHQGGIEVRLYAGRVVTILEQHKRSDGVLMLLVSWYDAWSGTVCQWVRADEVAE